MIYGISDIELSSDDTEEVFSTPTMPEESTGSLRKKVLIQGGRSGPLPPVSKVTTKMIMKLAIDSTEKDTVIEGITVALDMAEDALAQQEYIDDYCQQSKNIKTNVSQAISQHTNRIREFRNVLRNIKNVRKR